MLKPWPLVSSKPVGDFRIFSIRTDQKINPRTGKPCNFFVIDSANWVNIVAVTPDDHLVMVEQFRHGTNTIELEIPGGIMDPEDASPIEAGLRELREETGYEGSNARLLGDVAANPAIMSNTCFTVVVENCVSKHSLSFDGGEDLITRLVPVADLSRLVAEGRIKHPLVIVALFQFDLLRRGIKKV
jgi:ADP-ribose pyrophosphatase